jgi:hypothetical protein
MGHTTIRIENIALVLILAGRSALWQLDLGGSGTSYSAPIKWDMIICGLGWGRGNKFKWFEEA